MSPSRFIASEVRKVKRSKVKLRMRIIMKRHDKWAHDEKDNSLRDIHSKNN
ncbi:hypothetical protein DOY81_010879, partial [Sarcophaga bullata]